MLSSCSRSEVQKRHSESVYRCHHTGMLTTGSTGRRLGDRLGFFFNARGRGRGRGGGVGFLLKIAGGAARVSASNSEGGG